MKGFCHDTPSPVAPYIKTYIITGLFCMNILVFFRKKLGNFSYFRVFRMWFGNFFRNIYLTRVILKVTKMINSSVCCQKICTCKIP